MWELNHKEGQVPRNLYFQTAVLEKTLESPSDCKEIQPVHPKGNQPSIFIGRTDAEAETPILRPPDVKSWLTGKNPDADDSLVNDVKFMISEKDLASVQGPGLITQELLCSRVLLKWKRDRESFWHRLQKGEGECPFPLVLARELYTF